MRRNCAARKLVPAALLACLLLSGLLSAEDAPKSRPPAPRRPNIIFILADDLGYGDLGCYGQTKIKTPNLDQLAAQGTRFTSFYSGTTVCAPSRCVLMTGLHTGHCRIRGNRTDPLLPQDVTLAEVLKEAGYHTGLIGKWGLGNEDSTGVPQKQGFNDFAGFLDQVHAHDYFPTYLWRYDPRTQFDGRMELPENAGGAKELYAQTLFTDGALNFIRINKQERLNLYRPFFLYLAYTIPHANNEEGRRSGNGMQVPSDAPYSNESWPQPEKNKAAMITLLDADIGKLLQKLKDSHQDENTLILFSSDNGPHKEGGVDPAFFHSSGPFRGIKRDLYEGGIRVPFIAWWPGHIKAGKVVEEPWAFWDVLPTVAEVALAKAPAGIDGLSFWPELIGKTATNRHEGFYWEFYERGFQQAARVGDWKGIRNELGKPLELYNLKSDPGEKTDVASSNPQIVSKLDAFIKRSHVDSPAWPVETAEQQKQRKNDGKKD